jgi:hypothetical protein
MTFDLSREEYVDKLLENEVEIVGEWCNGTRPYFSSDTLDFKLAKLDSMNIEHLQHNI